MRKKSKKATPTSARKPEVFTSPESSNVEGGSYFRDSGEAVIAFRNKKDPDAETVYYSYDKVKPEHWDGLAKAESKGKYMLEVIRKQYKGVRVV